MLPTSLFMILSACGVDTFDTETTATVIETSTMTTTTHTEGLVEVLDPGPPAVTDTIGTLSVQIRNGDDMWDGTDNTTYLCLQESKNPEDDCFKLDHIDYDDNEMGDLGIWHFEGLSVPRDEVSSVSLAIKDGDNQWRPDCLDLRFDGEPVYCNDKIDTVLGDQTSESMVWTDPEGLHNSCLSCGDSPLTHGPLVGGTETDGFRIKVRTDATRQVILKAGLKADLSDAVNVAYAYPSPNDDFTATLEATGASADTDYYYGLIVDGVLNSSPFEPIHTAPPVGSPGQFNIAVGSCAKEEEQPIFSRIAERDPDLFLLIGDAHYADSGVLGTLRRYWRWSWERPEREALLAKVPSLTIWDDHDFIDNNSYGADHDEWPKDERENALRAIKEYTANPSYGEGVSEGVFFSYSYGDLDLFLIDNRYEREDPDDFAVPKMLGDKQYEWLLNAVTSSTATFKLLVSGSTWSPWTTNAEDAWQSHAFEREALLYALEEADVHGLILVSGDVHRSEFRMIDRPNGYNIPEITSSNLANSSIKPCQISSSDLVACIDGTELFVTMEFDTTAEDPTMTATIVDIDGTERAAMVVNASSLK